MARNVIEGIHIYLGETLRIQSAERNEAYYMIFKRETDEMIGFCGIRLREGKDMPYLGNIEYEIYEPFRGQGYAKEASLILGNVAYDWGVQSLTITANVKNKASINVIQSLGAKFIEVVKVPKKCCLYKQGDRLLAVYDWKIEKRNQL